MNDHPAWSTLPADVIQKIKQDGLSEYPVLRFNIVKARIYELIAKIQPVGYTMTNVLAVC